MLLLVVFRELFLNIFKSFIKITLLFVNVVWIDNEPSAKAHSATLVHLHVDLDEELGQAEQLYYVLQIKFRLQFVSCQAIALELLNLFLKLAIVLHATEFAEKAPTAPEPGKGIVEEDRFFRFQIVDFSLHRFFGVLLVLAY